MRAPAARCEDQARARSRAQQEPVDRTGLQKGTGLEMEQSQAPAKVHDLQDRLPHQGSGINKSAAARPGSANGVRTAAPLVLSPRYDEALAMARRLHALQFRKMSGAPYLCHLLEVSGLVLEYGGDEVQAIAALLHDALEDQSANAGGASALRESIRNRFGSRVLELVEICSDCESQPKPEWRVRKLHHLERLARASAYDCLIPACDRLHNLRSINSELRRGLGPFDRLKGGVRGQYAFIRAMVGIFVHKQLLLAAELEAEFSELGRLVALDGVSRPGSREELLFEALFTGWRMPAKQSTPTEGRASAC
jgi:GTP pyrophosphokinase